MLCRARRTAATSIYGLAAGGGSGGAFSTITSVEACVFSPRESVQVALTAIVPGNVPGNAPAVFSVAKPPLLETGPPLAVQPLTRTGTPSGLLHLADNSTLSPACILAKLAEREMVGGFFGGTGFTVKSAEQVASPFFFASSSLTETVTV